MMEKNELRIFVEMLKLVMENEELKIQAESLESRLDHLLESRYIRQFDSKNPHTGEYILPIRRADETEPIQHGYWIHCKGKSNLWYCSKCGGKILYNAARRTYKIEKQAVHEVNAFCRKCGVQMIGYRESAVTITIPHPTRKIGEVKYEP